MINVLYCVVHFLLLYFYDLHYCGTWKDQSHLKCYEEHLRFSYCVVATM